MLVWCTCVCRNMKGNLITRLHVNAFDGLSRLATLKMGGGSEQDGNPLTALTVGVFDGLSALRHLNFDNNHLTAVPSDLFSAMPNNDHM